MRNKLNNQFLTKEQQLALIPLSLKNNPRLKDIYKEYCARIGEKMTNVTEGLVMAFIDGRIKIKNGKYEISS